MPLEDGQPKDARKKTRSVIDSHLLWLSVECS